MNKVGVIMLNTRFPRLPGDIACSLSFDAECKIIRLDKSRVANIVQDQIASELIEEIVSAALQLQTDNATIITTSCGFLGLIQKQIQARLRVPFVASSLSLIPLLRTLFGANTPIGVMTFDSTTLGKQHFTGSWDQHICIAGIENGQELHSVIKNDDTTLNRELAQRDALAAADSLLEQGARCLLLECTNLSPYKPAIRKHTGLPVFDLVDTINWFCKA